MTKKPKMFAFTGRLRIGKDFVSSQIHGTVFGFADPFYQIAKNLFRPPLDKDKTPGLRKFYQELGQLGRGEISEDYPLSISRAVAVDWWRHHGDRFTDFPVTWSSFGSNPRIWVDCLLGRIHQYLELVEHPPVGDDEIPVSPSGVICVSNVRFQNERQQLREAGFDVWHIMSSQETWETRLRQAGLSPTDPKLNDLSEQLAIKADREVLQIVRRQKVGPRLKVIWNDHRPSPSERLYSLEQFKAYVQPRKQQIGAVDSSTGKTTVGDGGQAEAPRNPADCNSGKGCRNPIYPKKAPGASRKVCCRFNPRVVGVRH